MDLIIDPSETLVDQHEFEELAAAQPAGHVESNFNFPDQMTPTPPYTVASDGDICENPWMEQFQVSGIAELPNPKEWGPADIKNAFQSDGLYPQVGRSQNVPLYQEPLPPEAINPKRRAITTAELRGNPFHASRRDMIQRVNADRFRENVCSWDPAGTYGCKNSKQPGADYVSPDGNIGWQTGLQMIQRPTNKDPSRLRVFQREMTYRTTFAEDAPRKTTHIGIPLETMRGGDIRLPKNMHVSNYFRPPVPTTGPGGVRQEAPFYPRSAQYTQTGRSALSNYAGGSFAKEFAERDTDCGDLAPPPSAEAGDTSYSSAGAYFRASDPAPTPELQQLRECIESKPDAVYLGANIEFPDAVPNDSSDDCPSGRVAGNGLVTPTVDAFRPLVSDDVGYFGVPHANVRVGPALRPAAGAGHVRNRRTRKVQRTAIAAASHVPAGHSSRVSTIDRDQTQGRLTTRDVLYDDMDFRFGPTRLNQGTGFEADHTSARSPDGAAFFGESAADAARANSQHLRETRRQQASFAHEDASRSLMRTRNTEANANRLTYGTLFMPIDHKKSPIIVQEPDRALLAPFLNNPYRNVPVSDGCGNWLPVAPPPTEYYTGDVSQFATES